MGQGKFKPASRSKGKRQIASARKNKFRPRSAFFRREAEWMTWMNLAPFGIGFVLALIFWFTR